MTDLTDEQRAEKWGEGKGLATTHYLSGLREGRRLEREKWRVDERTLRQANDLLQGTITALQAELKRKTEALEKAKIKIQRGLASARFKAQDDIACDLEYGLDYANEALAPEAEEG